MLEPRFKMRSNVERQLPHGVADLYFEDAANKSRLEAKLRESFGVWGYSEVIPPTFEYYEALASEISPQVREEIYRFADRDGRMLALRADPTIPIARLVGTKLQDRPLPLRLFYVANVFRYEEPKASLRREFTQAGVELIGAGSPQADAEVVALAVSVLRDVGLKDFRVRLGAMDFVAALLDELGLSVSQSESIRGALERKNVQGLSELLETATVSPELRNALAALPQLSGDVEVLIRAERDCAINESARESIGRLREMWSFLDALGCAEAVTLDLAMVRGMAYYTGIVFEAFARGVGFAIMSGGRYDNLLAHFGRDLPALGFAIGVERGLAALAVQGSADAKLAPDIVAEMSVQREFERSVMAARAAGKHVESFLGVGRDELVAFARARGAQEVWFADGSAEVLT